MRTPRAEIPRLLELSRDRDAKVRRKAIQALCPCEVKLHDAGIWERFIEMAHDPDADVRRSIVHVLCDGSPAIYEARILEVLNTLRNDANERVKKSVRKVLAAHRHSGTLNIL